MAPDPMRSDRRREGRARRLPPGGGCVVCGEARPELLHLHHPVTKDIDEAAVGLRCLTHHREADLAREDAGCHALAPPRTVPERVIAAARGLAAEHRLLADGLERWADDLERFFAGLDAAGVPWRDMPGARP